VNAVQREGGKITLADLQSYQPIWSEPVSTGYHGHQVYARFHRSLDREADSKTEPTFQPARYLN
jgi:hypothetical protein